MLAPGAHGQSVAIYSEFQRPDPFGGIVAPDRALAQREILSPALARGAHLTLHIAVNVPPPESYLLYVSPNPTNACQMALYREHFQKTAAGWIPDRLQEVKRLPDFGAMPDPDDGIEGQNTRAYLLELWVAPNAPVGRFRVEVQLKMGDWTVSPMEVRVIEAHLDSPVAGGGDAWSLPPAEESADAAAIRILAGYESGTMGGAPPVTTVRGAICRDTLEDLTLAAPLPKQEIASRAFDLMWRNLQFTPRVFGAEWWLRMRDWIYRQGKSVAAP